MSQEYNKKLNWDSVKNFKLKRFSLEDENKFILNNIKGLETLTELFILYVTVDKELTDIIKSFNNLENLEFYSCKIESLSGLEKLEHLKTLTHTNIDNDKSISEISKLSSLNELNLYAGDNSNTIKMNSLGNLNNLKILYLHWWNLDQNRIDFITKLTNLEELYLEFIFVNEDIDLSSFKNLKKLKTFSFVNSRKHDKGLLNSIDKLTSVQNLVFEADTLGSSDLKRISKLTNLKQLTISQENYKSDIDVTPLESLQKLTNITLHYFKLKEIPKFVVSLSDLKYIDLSYNKISEIPDFVTDLKNIEYLNLGSNEFKEIPQSLNKLPKLKYINLSDNDELKGHILTNDSLEYCNYSISNMYVQDGICTTKDMKCISNVILREGSLCCHHEYPQEINYCEDEITKTTTTTTKTRTTTSSTIISSTITTTTKTTQKSYPTSTNGKCGARDGQCPIGECCSKYGYCGRSDKHCLPSNGCQSEFGQCHNSNNDDDGDLKITTNGRCSRTDGKCPAGECCSKYGWCGRSDDHCGKGCQSEFGQCKSTTAKTTTKTTTKTKTTKKSSTKKSSTRKTSTKKTSTKKTSTTKKFYPTTTNGKCGAKDGKCPTGECCSKYGYCGRSDKHCLSSNGCQSEFGQCR